MALQHPALKRLLQIMDLEHLPAVDRALLEGDFYIFDLTQGSFEASRR